MAGIMPLGAAEYGSEEQLNIPPYANQGSQARKYCFTKGPRAGEQNSDDPDKVAYHSGSGTLRLWHRESPMDKDDEGIPRRMKQRRSFGDGHVSSAGTLRPQWQGIMWSTSNMALQSPLLHAQVQVGLAVGPKRPCIIKLPNFCRTAPALTPFHHLLGNRCGGSPHANAPIPQVGPEAQNSCQVGERTGACASSPEFCFSSSRSHAAKNLMVKACP